MEHDHVVYYAGLEIGINMCAGLEDGIMDEHAEITLRRIDDHDFMLRYCDKRGIPVYRGDTADEIAQRIIKRKHYALEQIARS